MKPLTAKSPCGTSVLKKKSKAEPLTGEDIQTIREQAHMSQGVFAHYLNLVVGYISIEGGGEGAFSADLPSP